MEWKIESFIMKYVVLNLKAFHVKIVSNLKSFQQCNAANKANTMLGFINKNFSLKNKDVILSLYNNLVRPHLECRYIFGFPIMRRTLLNLVFNLERERWSLSCATNLSRKAFHVLVCSFWKNTAPMGNWLNASKYQMALRMWMNPNCVKLIIVHELEVMALNLSVNN